MRIFYSGSYALPKKGGPRMKVRWYIDDTHVETTWFQNGKFYISIFHEDELESVDDQLALNIDVVEETLAISEKLPIEL